MATEISPAWKEQVRRFFPDLREGVSLEFTSPADPNYNCLAWAVGANFSPFENAKGAFWPWPQIPDDTADGWAQVCEIFGFTRIGPGATDFVPGYEKIAIFEGEEGVSHACRQDRSGRWKSKLGVLGPDVDHDGLGGLEASYGHVAIVLQRPRPDW